MPQESGRPPPVARETSPSLLAHSRPRSLLLPAPGANLVASEGHLLAVLAARPPRPQLCWDGYLVSAARMTCDLGLRGRAVECALWGRISTA